ncbi:hypothetical protein GAY33_04330 [Azospirillum brasilense]|uniref:hypothetical protein n=1 Tax=Azospirillum argentinense TaxID=2970906 RepID=UPI00190E3DD4|nr:hypothetical protein [Azospirillum argentinense]MBK3798466.1 hypothetical protein [Azospirillum argentinense]
MNWAIVFAVTTATLVALKVATDPRPPDRVADLGRAAAVAETALSAHRAAENWVATHPAAMGPVPLTATNGRRFDGVASCVMARRVATWVTETAGAPAFEIGRAMRARLQGWPAAGVAGSGRVLAGSENRATIPCAVPDGAPVVVTVVLS